MRATVLVVSILTLAAAGAAPADDVAVNRPLLGIAGSADRFAAQTAQQSAVRSVFIGWGQGQTWGSPFARLLAGLGPVPMVHIGTAADPSLRREAISPRGIAQGKGDGYLVAVNNAIAAYGGQIYIRFLAEMNNPKSLYAPRRPDGASRGADHAPAWYRAAFRRAFIIFHGGTPEQVNARLRAAGLPPTSGALTANPYPRLTMIWNPLAGLSLAREFYPGNAHVDMVGNDMYASRHGIASYDANERLYRAHPRKPYALPEWGLEGIDDPSFVERICAFLKTHLRTKLAAYYEARSGSSYDLGNKARSRSAYQRCVTPIGAPPVT